MANEKGTGQHAHKSSEEPYPHHEAPTTSGEGSSHSGRSNGDSSQSSSRSSSSRSSGSEGRTERSSGESSDLKEREYRDKDGNIHHHTHTAKAMKDSVFIS